MRQAVAEDLPAVVALLADDPLGKTREQAGPEVSDAYRKAFHAIAMDPHHRLLVTERDGAIVAVLQLSFLPGLTYEGGWRAQIEGVRVATHVRGEGVGSDLIRMAVALARTHGCRLVQLTTDKRRPEALGFYEKLGFVASHEGMKLHLETGDAAP